MSGDDRVTVEDDEVTAAELHQHRSIAQLVGGDRRVVVFGSGTAALTEVLTGQGCRVVAVDIDTTAAAVTAAFAKRVIVADPRSLHFMDALRDERFDVAVFIDFLEQLPEPERVLSRTLQLLDPGGVVVVRLSGMETAAAPQVSSAAADGRQAELDPVVRLQATALIDMDARLRENRALSRKLQAKVQELAAERDRKDERLQQILGERRRLAERERPLQDRVQQLERQIRQLRAEAAQRQAIIDGYQGSRAFKVISALWRAEAGLRRR